MKLEARYRKRLGQFSLDCDFSMPDRGITILFGPSGSGKSTLLNCIAGLDSAQHAYCRLADMVFDDSDRNIKLPASERRTGYVFQDSRLFPHLNVRKNLLYGHKRTRQSERDVQLDHIVENFSLGELLEHYPHQLSGGQKQRVALGRALLSSPRLLILDEPLSALDAAAKQELLPCLDAIHREFTIPVIYVSHDIKEVLQLGDYILVMDQGRIIDHGDLVDLCVSQPLLTRTEGASFILKGGVTQVDREQSISTVNCNGHEILLSGRLLEHDQDVRILVHASDVSLSLSHARDSSILNILPVVVDSIHPAINGKHLVECLLDEERILAMISMRSVKTLQLEKGKQLFAQFKATAMVR